MKHYPARTPSLKIEDELHDMYDGATPMWAVEVFGPPEAMAYDKREDCETGPWVIGTREEVQDYLADCQFDWEVQHEIDHTE